MGPETSAKLLLIRHGQTAGNKQRYVGWEDLPLDEVGRRQAHAVADLLREEPIHAVYSSPLIRAVETARPLAAGHHLDIRTREDLKEIDFGQFQGLLKTEQHIRLRHDHQFTPMPGGESLHDVYLRIGRFLDELRPELAAGRTVAVTGHYWSSRILAGRLSHIPFEEMFVRKNKKPKTAPFTKWCSESGGASRFRRARAGSKNGTWRSPKNKSPRMAATPGRYRPPASAYLGRTFAISQSARLAADCCITWASR